MAKARRLRFPWAEGHETLYKFKSLRGEAFAHVMQTIVQSRIYFPSPEQFNDPLDCAPVFELAGDPDDPAFAAELVADQERLIRESGMTAEQVAQVKAGEAVEIHQLARAITDQTRQALLWSHYADSHAGVCLHFSSKGGTFFGGARRVLYWPERASILIPISHTPEDEIPERMVFHKAKFWDYESEYRLIAHDTPEAGGKVDSTGLAEFDIGLLQGITLGCKINAANRETILWAARARRPTLEVWEASENPKIYRMDIHRMA
jgi:hypothetical protein